MAAQEGDARRRLSADVAALLDGALGAFPWRSPGGDSRRASVLQKRPWSGVIGGVAYGLVFIAFPAAALALSRQSFEPHLLGLQIFGSLYFAWASTTARAASSAVLERVQQKIIPAMGADACRTISGKIGRVFRRTRVAIVSTAAAALGTAMALWIIHRDAPGNGGAGVVVQQAWWSLGWFFILLTAARATYVARFYTLFSRHLADDPDALYAVQPKDSRIVTDLSAVGRTMLMFWLGIALSIVCLIPFEQLCVTPIGAQTVASLIDPRQSRFFLFIAAVVFPFSIPFGTLVFLRNESNIRRAVDTAAFARLRSLEVEVATLDRRRNSLSGGELERFAALNALHKELSAAGGYRDLFANGASLAVSLAGPVLTLVAGLLSSQPADHHVASPKPTPAINAPHRP